MRFSISFSTSLSIPKKNTFDLNRVFIFSISLWKTDGSTILFPFKIIFYFALTVSSVLISLKRFNVFIST